MGTDKRIEMKTWNKTKANHERKTQHRTMKTHMHIVKLQKIKREKILKSLIKSWFVNCGYNLYTNLLIHIVVLTLIRYLRPRKEGNREKTEQAEA